MDSDSGYADNSGSFWDQTVRSYQQTRDTTRYATSDDPAARQKYDEACTSGPRAPDTSNPAYFLGGIPGAVVGAAEGLWDGLF